MKHSTSAVWILSFANVNTIILVTYNDFFPWTKRRKNNRIDGSLKFFLSCAVNCIFEPLNNQVGQLICV